VEEIMKRTLFMLLLIMIVTMAFGKGFPRFRERLARDAIYAVRAAGEPLADFAQRLRSQFPKRRTRALYVVVREGVVYAAFPSTRRAIQLFYEIRKPGDTLFFSSFEHIVEIE
jgi:hypothetical protein